MQVLTAPLSGREEEGKGKTIPQQIPGGPERPPGPTLCGHEVSASSLGPAGVGLLLVLHVPCAERRRRRRRGRVSVSVCPCVANPPSEGSRTTPCVAPLPVLVRGVSPEVFLV